MLAITCHEDVRAARAWPAGRRCQRGEPAAVLALDPVHFQFLRFLLFEDHHTAFLLGKQNYILKYY
jgi:hypothetical protein